MNRQLESMTKVRLGRWVVRVWRTEADLSKLDNNDIHALGAKLCNSEQPDAQGIAHEFEKLPRVSAVEVVDWLGNGILIYPDWN
jgi:hypothetical protein